MARALVAASKAKSLGARLSAFAGIRPRDLVPDTPAIAEPSTGLSMGQSAEKMAKENGDQREEQDQIALLRPPATPRAATDDGRCPRRCAPSSCRPRYEAAVTADNRCGGTRRWRPSPRCRRCSTGATARVTAGNASPLTDGAAAVLLMAEDKAKAVGYEPLAFIRSWAVAAVDPGGQLLMGPALAIPMALDRAGLKLSDIDLVDMHEAFAAQVASNLQALESETWAREKLGRASSGRRGRPRAAERQRRLDRPRAPVRRDGRPHHDHPGERAEAARAASSACSPSARRAAWASPWCSRR